MQAYQSWCGCRLYAQIASAAQLITGGHFCPWTCDNVKLSSFRSSNTIHFKCTCSQVPEQTDPRPAFTCSSKSVITDVKQTRGKWQHLSALGKYSQFQQCNTDWKPMRWLRTCICPLTTNIWFTSEGRGEAMSRSCLKLTGGGGGRSVWSQPKT